MIIKAHQLLQHTHVHHTRPCTTKPDFPATRILISCASHTEASVVATVSRVFAIPVRNVAAVAAVEAAVAATTTVDALGR